jgi:hypothetical protein
MEEIKQTSSLPLNYVWTIMHLMHMFQMHSVSCKQDTTVICI